MAVMFQV